MTDRAREARSPAGTSTGLLLLWLTMVSVGSEVQAQAAPEDSALPPPEEAGLALEGVEDIASLDLETLLSAPVVEAASRRTQSVHEAPVSVTLLRSEELQRMPLLSVPDALEQVVGLDVSRVSVNTPALGSRGFTEGGNNRMPLLIDGRMVNTAFQDGPLWEIVGLHPRDLERIEVVHGPGSTLYGANAVSGVILLTSKRPLDHIGSEAEGAATLSVLPDLQDDPYSGRAMNASGIAYLAHGIASQDRRMGARLSLGLGQTPEGLPGDVPTNPGIHGPHRVAARLALDYRPGDGQRLELDLSGIQQESRNRTGGVAGGSRSLNQEQALRLLWSDMTWLDGALSTRLLADVRRLNTDNNGFPFQTERLHVLGLGDLDLTAARSVITAGAELALERFEGFSLDNGRRLYAAAVLQNETALLQDRALLLNAGLRAEQIQVRSPDSSITYRNLNPRAALIWRPHKAHDLRAVFTTAYRTPTPSESLVGVSIPQAGGIPTVRIVLPRTDLQPESVRSYELGYRGEFGGKLYLELSSYYQQLRNLTQFPSGPPPRPTYSANLQDLDQAGLEASARLQPTTWLSGHTSYTYCHTLSSRIEPESSYLPAHLASASLDLHPFDGWYLRADTSFASTLTTYNAITQGNLSTQALTTTPVRARLHLKAALSVLEGSGEVFLAARNILAMFRPEDQLLEVTNSDPIGAQIMLGFALFQEEPDSSGSSTASEGM